MEFLSDYTRAIEGDQVVLWHRFLGHPLLISSQTWTLLKNGEIQQLDCAEHEMLKEAGFIVSREYSPEYWYQQIDKELQKGCQFEFLKTAFLVVTNSCNLNCQYCMFSSLGENETLNLSFDSFTKSMKSIHHFFQRNDTPLVVSFSGGEPLLRDKFVFECVSYLEQTYPLTKFDFRILTNGTLLSDNIAKLLKKYNFHLHLSIDGLAEEHSIVRPFVADESRKSFDSILNLSQLVKKYDLAIGAIQITICESNFKLSPNEIIKFIKNTFNINRISVEPDITFAKSCIAPEEMTDKLLDFLIEGDKQEVEITGFWLRPYLSLFEDFPHKTRLTWCGATRGSGLVITPDGHWKPCAYLNDKLGNIGDSECIVINNWQEWCGNYRAYQREKCKGCELEFLCMGGCLVSHRQEESFAYRCQLYKNVFHALLKRHLS